ncbi:PIN domain-containing protein [Micromonospora sp. NPDC005237]|uniref:PIN domain-containing protein n=1 Tax=Micromonospora sp. NPDC005237 TaxID=3155113 RepID=UPI0033B3CB9A
MITVIVDTTTTFIDVMMKSTSWMQLLTLCDESKIQVVLPDVVLRETARHWEAEVSKTIQTANGKIAGIKKSREKLTEMGIDASSLVDSTPVMGTPDRARFEEETRAKLVSLGIQVEPVPDHVDIESVLRRDLARKKPFTDNGKGFRDTLVWETAKQVVMESEAGDKIFLVTNNSTDYCDETGALAPELYAEVKSAAGELARVADLEELLKHGALAPMVAGLAKTPEQLATFLALAASTRSSDAEPLSVDQVVENAVMQALEQLAGEEVETGNPTTSGLDFTELTIPSELEGLSIASIEPDESTLIWQTYETYQDSTLLIQAEIDAEVTLDGFAYKSDLGYRSEDERVYVLEWDWNDHMAYVGTTTNARLSFQIRLEQGMDFVEECEFEGAHPLVGEDPHPWKAPPDGSPADAATRGQGRELVGQAAKSMVAPPVARDSNTTGAAP